MKVRTVVYGIGGGILGFTVGTIAAPIVAFILPPACAIAVGAKGAEYGLMKDKEAEVRWAAKRLAKEEKRKAKKDAEMQEDLDVRAAKEEKLKKKAAKIPQVPVTLEPVLQTE